MNTEAMFAVADVIEYTDRFDMGVYIDAPSAAALWEDCGTVGCFAGWACAWSNREPRRDGNLSAFDIGEEEFGLTRAQSYRLFAPSAGDQRFWNELGVASPFEMTAVEASAALRRIARGEVVL